MTWREMKRYSLWADLIEARTIKDTVRGHSVEHINLALHQRARRFASLLLILSSEHSHLVIRKVAESCRD